ncbi:hypothetical protein N7456_007018 [Penicillium angulare]|uniref:Chromo domain-containing protein n=1 Tax=Penicillium angulare TaxID=116970 RepID=A0A9W9KCR1_9EURO|nr:hypothetical protein N7456_007018 [Penicillium angulare]
MSRRQYCHDSSWRWNPFQDNSVCREKPQYQQNVTDTCSYPIPVSITANSSASILDENGQNTLQSCSIKAQRHPLPARPPTEVCLGDGSRSSNQSDQLQADDSQKLTPDEHILQNLGSSGPVQTLEHSDTAYIDPKILINGPSPNVESVATAGNYPDPDLTGNRSSPKSPSLNASFISVWPTSSRQCETEDTMMLDQPAFRAATSSPSWNKTTHNGATQSHKRTGFHKDPSFSSVRSQFLAMSVGGRLQFLSWLFEGTLQQCVSMPTGFNLAATNEGDHWLNESVINDFPVRNQHIEPVDVQDISWDEGGSEAMQIHQIEYEVEKILKHMQSARGSVSYLVKWKGYDDTEATWEPFDSVQDTAALEYYERQLVPAMERRQSAL